MLIFPACSRCPATLRSGKVMAEVKAELAEMAKTSEHVRLMAEFIHSGKRPLARG